MARTCENIDLLTVENRKRAGIDRARQGRIIQESQHISNIILYSNLVNRMP